MWLKGVLAVVIALGMHPETPRERRASAATVRAPDAGAAEPGSLDVAPRTGPEGPKPATVGTRKPPKWEW